MTPEGKILKEIRDALRKLGMWVTRIHCGKVRVRGGWMQLSEPGVADLLVMDKGRTIWIEVKAPKGTHEEAQKAFRERALAAGHLYVLAKSVEDVLKAL